MEYLKLLNWMDRARGGSQPAPGSIKIKPIGQLIGTFKTVSAIQIDLSRGTPGLPIWQRNYYEHIICDQSDLESISEYILANPGHWSDHSEYIQ